MFKMLGIRIKMIGSAMEGTKIFILDEADCFIHFDNLKPNDFELTDSATKYKVTEEGKPLLTKFMDDEGNLDYFKFLELLLAELERFLKEGCLEGMTVSFARCEHKVKGGGAFHFLKHCENCLPAVTFTKAGPCLILKDGNEIISIDLIPLLPCPVKDPIKMFGLVTSYLVEGNPPNWLPYLKKFVKSDVLLPEVLGNPKLPEDGYTAMKLLQADSDHDLFILRPGQSLAMQNLQQPKLKRTYCYLKALKSLMGVDLSSYQLKKVLLLEEFSQLAGTAVDATHLLYLALTHHHLHSAFHKQAFNTKTMKIPREIDFDAWKKAVDEHEEASGGKDPICTGIPLKIHLW